MKVLHVIPSLSRSSGGPARSVQGLAASLSQTGVEAWLLSLHWGERPWVDGVNHFVNGKPFEDVLLTIKPDIVHIHSIWSPELHRCAVICRRWGIKYVIAPRGMLEPWSLQQKWLKKRIARFLYQDNDLKHAAALHATAEIEESQFRKLGFTNPIIISPNGVNVPSSPIQHSSSLTHEMRLLFVSRMHPKKGVAELVDALNSIKRSQPMLLKSLCVELVYTLSDDLEREYEAKIKDMVASYGLTDKFVFTGALNDDEKWKAYARADLFALPTYSENFGIVVAEALWAGVPVITTKGTPWKDLDEHNCGKWIDIGVEPLTVALMDMLSLPIEALRRMGANGRKLVEAKYTWPAVVKAMVEGYKAIL